MTMSSHRVDRVTGQVVSPGFAANDLVVSGPGYEYTFQITGWGWVNMLAGMLLAATAVGLFLSATGGRVAAIIVTCLPSWSPSSGCRTTRLAQLC
jgi:hypothetical protein